MNNSNGIEAVESSYGCRAVAAVADRLSVYNFRSHERLPSSELQRLNKLISEEEIGDRKPSQFFRIYILLLERSSCRIISDGRSGFNGSCPLFLRSSQRSWN
ncbi:hypothetical protein J6590_018163 [Homalodisca vitripennis]|nr:hypothetical protein J6590_018163 [Homalodisca vitripennis]